MRRRGVRAPPRRPASGPRRAFPRRARRTGDPVSRLPADARAQRAVQPGSLARGVDRAGQGRVPLHDRVGKGLRVRAQQGAQERSSSASRSSWPQGDCRRSEISADNYEFRGRAGATESGTSSSSRSARTSCSSTAAWCSARTGRTCSGSKDGCRRTRRSGRASVNVIRHYARLDGVRVPVSTESIAKVKFAGLSQLEVRYEYETINGRPVSPAAPPARSPRASRARQRRGPYPAQRVWRGPYRGCEVSRGPYGERSEPPLPRERKRARPFSPFPLTFYKSERYPLVVRLQEDGWRKSRTCSRARSIC